MARVGTGAKLDVAGTATTATYEVLSMSIGGQVRETIDTSHLLTTVARTHQPGDLYEPGEISIDVQWDNLDPEMGFTFNNTEQTAATQVMTFTAPTTNADSQFTVVGMLKTFDLTVPLEEKMTATVVYKLSGALTWA